MNRHSRGDNDEIYVVQVVPWFMLMYIPFVHEISNEALVEGMFSVVAKHVTGTRGVIFDIMYAKEKVIMIYNNTNKLDRLLSNALSRSPS
jgi:hypothetical protein